MSTPTRYEDAGDFSLDNFADNHVSAYLKNPATRYVAMTGSEVTKQLIVPYPHRIVKMIFRHANSSNVDQISPFNIQIRRDAGQIYTDAQMKEILIDQPNMIDANVTITFGNGFEYEPTTWTVALNGTSTDRIYVLFYLQRLGRGGKN